jgi:hypothetical protein
MLRFRIIQESTMADKPNPLAPDVQTLVLLGSALIHAEEYMSENGHDVDKIAFDDVMNNPKVKAWVEQMNGLAMLPLKR